MADKNIIDGIEYESEPHPDYLIDGKPVYYAQNVPASIRMNGDTSERNVDEAKKLDNLLPLERLEKGPDAWNLWVMFHAERWLRRVVTKEATYLSWKPLDDVEPKYQDIDFGWGQTKDENGRYLITEYDFHGMVFPVEANFINARFSKGGLFSKAEFVGTGRFDRALFEGPYFASFMGTKFRRWLWLCNTEFTCQTNFTGALFQRWVLVESAKFHDRVSFRGAVFRWVADFDNTEFFKTAHFDDTVFFYSASWNNIVAHSNVDFQRSQFLLRMSMHSLGPSKTTFANSRFDGYVNFDQCWFGKEKGTPLPVSVDTADGEFGGYENWSAELQSEYVETAITHESITIPDFRGSRFHNAPNLSYVHITFPAHEALPKTIGAIAGGTIQRLSSTDESAASKLRKLGELAHQGHHHLAEKRFFRAELLSRRGHETRSWREVAMINAFELFSKCGLSFWRPLGWLLGLVLLSSLFYGLQISWPAGESGPFELASYSFANSLPLLGYISDSYDVSVNVLFGGVDKVPPWVRVWAFFQNLVSAILIFFALLAIRNYFKLG
ncbi:MAG: pentapeptide repeat-containing protein [Kordiimonadaceae bacterium]|nr:pentapeptide repeat-containing protein [Kordiimonadaceae bacterium]MBO6569613.1 pentapeptide repeat-containing protein [Kordiimonadaceae bacterium]MBO6966148.1 pentapeptide repeat-containing protein [Kordiimonadaceae bacterium]